MDSTIRQRDHELTEIAKSISELADLFRDLGNLVVEQGTVLDCVEYNVQETAKDVGAAVEELKVATRLVSEHQFRMGKPVLLKPFTENRYQRNAGRRRCIFLL